MDSQIRDKISLSWNEWAKNYDNCYPHTIKSERELELWKIAIKGLTGDSGKNVLDVGTGTGFIAIILSELGHHVKGVDISEGMMKEAEKKASEHRLDIQFNIEDAEQLDEPDNTYDIVINRYMLWTMQYPERAIIEWIRVLKPGGKLIIIDCDWFNKKLSYQINVFLGNLLVALTEKRNPWKEKTYFDGELKNRLPLTKYENERNILWHLDNFGLENITISKLEDIEREEKKAMSLKDKMLNPHKKIVIEGFKRK